MGTLVCRIELSKTEGITITVENNDDGIIQTAVLNGESITLKSAGSETSTIVQKPDSITIDCKKFKLNAGTIECISQQDTKHTSGAKYEVSSTTDMNLKTSTNLQATASINAGFKGTMTTVEGQTTTIKGTLVQVQGNLIKLG